MPKIKLASKCFMDLNTLIPKDTKNLAAENSAQCLYYGDGSAFFPAKHPKYHQADQIKTHNAAFALNPQNTFYDYDIPLAPQAQANFSNGKQSGVQKSKDNATDSENTWENSYELNRLRQFLSCVTGSFADGELIKRFTMPNGDHISCIKWRESFYITGTDIVKILFFRFALSGKTINNHKKFEEGIFSDLRNLKPGIGSILEEPKSPFLEFLHRNGCIRTQKKQKVFFWNAVNHEQLFTDALERAMRRDKSPPATQSHVSGTQKTAKSSTKKSSPFVPTAALNQQKPPFPGNTYFDIDQLNSILDYNAVYPQTTAIMPPIDVAPVISTSFRDMEHRSPNEAHSMAIANGQTQHQQPEVYLKSSLDEILKKEIDSLFYEQDPFCNSIFTNDSGEESWQI